MLTNAPRAVAVVFFAGGLLAVASPARATDVDGARLVRVLGPHARGLAAPGASLGAFVAIPPGRAAAALGLRELAPGVGAVRGTPQDLLAFADAHPDLRLEVTTPLHPLLDRVGGWIHANDMTARKGLDGSGVLVGVADTGLDVTHPDLRGPDGKTRVRWILDMSLRPAGIYPDLESRFGVTASDGSPRGLVLSNTEIDMLLSGAKIARKNSQIANDFIERPQDEGGHGTHVTSIASGNGGTKPHTPYVGVAPAAGIVFARVTLDSSDAIDPEDVVRGVSFLFDRGDAEKKPIAVNLSLGTDFGPHDGTMVWEKSLASQIGEDHPGHALVVAAGNSGSILETPIHQSVHVNPGDRMRVPVVTKGGNAGRVQVWVTMRAFANVKIGLEAPDGSEWIAPVGDNDVGEKDGDNYLAGVVNGSGPMGSMVPMDSHGANVVWTGNFPRGIWAITLQGAGTVDLYLEAGGDLTTAGFVNGVREGTVNLPATHPAIIGVGCTVNRTGWTTSDGIHAVEPFPLLDGPGGLMTDAGPPARLLQDGEVCWFSSAGPTVTGVPKPEISAPGGLVAAAFSSQAAPNRPGSIFSPPCVTDSGSLTGDLNCYRVDDTHGIAQGTSMSAPMVTGTAALLFQSDPTLTQAGVVAALQGGAHAIRGLNRFPDQGGPGELDVVGAINALDAMKNPANVLPSAADSWMTLSTDYLAADGSTPLTAILELRTAGGGRGADMLGDRLQAKVVIDGIPQSPPPIVRRGPGVYTFDVQTAAGQGGRSMTIGATFDGAPVVTPQTVPIAPDIWASEYAARATGGCRATRGVVGGGASVAWFALAAAGLGVRRRGRLSRPK
jgi:subtilisin family serine protease